MENKDHIVALLDIISEQRQAINELKQTLSVAQEQRDRYQRWWLDEESKVKEHIEALEKKNSKDSSNA